ANIPPRIAASIQVAVRVRRPKIVPGVGSFPAKFWLTRKRICKFDMAINLQRPQPRRDALDRALTYATTALSFTLNAFRVPKFVVIGLNLSVIITRIIQQRFLPL